MNFFPPATVWRRVFGIDFRGMDNGAYKITIHPPQAGMPTIEFGAASETLRALTGHFPRAHFSIRIIGSGLQRYEEIHSAILKYCNSLFFQVDMYYGIPFGIVAARRSIRNSIRERRGTKAEDDLTYPTIELDEEAAALYWYARSAAGMPLLQFLAFYQVLEFYFPAFSQSEAQRRIRSILKDPTFRADRDADITKILAAMRTNKSGSFGDEKTQLKATMTQIVDAAALREFLQGNTDRREYFSSKVRSGRHHRVSLHNDTADLRDDVAERIYDIRCKIVHTKNDTNNAGSSRILPFSDDADALYNDIDLVGYLAQKALIVSASTFNSR